MQNKKVLLIGFDGATWDLIKPWTEQNELPNFKILMETGCYGSLKSTVPHVTPPAWTSLTTGKNPGKHIQDGQHQPGKRTCLIVRKDEYRYLGSYRGSKNKTFWVPGLLPRTRPGRTLHPA